MDHGEILQQFCSVTGAETDFALTVLEANDWDLETCINLYLEGNVGSGSKSPGGAGGRKSAPPPRSVEHVYDDKPNAQGSNVDPRTLGDAELARAMSSNMADDMIPPEVYGDGGGAYGGLSNDGGGAMYSDDSAMYDPEGIRAPIMPKSEVLVEDDPSLMFAQLRRRQQRGGEQSNNVFAMPRDFRAENKMVNRGANSAEDQYNKKIRTLADLFKPPIDLMQQGTFDHVKKLAFQRKKWLLVNIQEVANFDCQKMNRDTWADAAVKSIVRDNFILFQVLKPTEEGTRYCNYYPVDMLPHLAIIDSLTGELLESWEGFTEPKQMVLRLEQFLASHSFDNQAPPARPRPASPMRLGDMSEEAQLAAAVAASLGRGHDDDDEANSNPSDAHVSSTSTTTSTSTSTSTPATSTSTTTPPPPTVIPNAAASSQTPTATVSHGDKNAAISNSQQQQQNDLLKAKHANPSPECTCVIQVRMPQNQIKGHFQASDTLSLVHQYVAAHLDNPAARFSLVTTFPKKNYTGEMLNITLKEADLVPRAVLICEMNE